MKSLIICVSKSHGNTRRVADRMAEVLDAEVVEPESVDPETLGEYDLVGFGSGIYYLNVDARLPELISRLPHVPGIRAFTFFTSGARQIPLLDYNKPVRNQLASKGFQVLDSFSCRGFDTVGPFGLIGGINRGRPDDRDLERAAAFAARLRKQVAGSQATS
ncbi:flavodoxin family protein [Mycolicibacterium aubagnense]|uniref:flavodoxin family protein n=1 Tax=Mycolicibacterium aubagnense TaxID=319707 RepID=UPI001477302F|nr:flavodoxin family protein [Mycolicibacterium aubagnense]WGI30413.1 flavodoxin family protein [Mycolicibacterium aubagnense]